MCVWCIIYWGYIEVGISSLPTSMVKLFKYRMFDWAFVAILHNLFGSQHAQYIHIKSSSWAIYWITIYEIQCCNKCFMLYEEIYCYTLDFRGNIHFKNFSISFTRNSWNAFVRANNMKKIRKTHILISEMMRKVKVLKWHWNPQHTHSAYRFGFLLYAYILCHKSKV